jgi:heavy metal sensor kinase
VHKPDPRSIRVRLTAWYAGILAATFVCAAVLASVSLRHSIRVTVDKQLRARFATVSNYVQRAAGEERESHLREELNENAVADAASGYLRIADATGSWLYRSPNTEKWPDMSLRREQLPPRGVIETLRINGQRMRVLSAPVKIGTVQIGLPVDEFDELQDDFIWTVLLGTPLLFCIASAAGYWISGRALRPVDRIASTARRITVENLSERLPSSGAGDELDRLSQVLNEMLAGLESAFRRITQFTADASHELRTPLAIIRTTAEVIRGRTRTLAEHDRAWASVLAQTERTSQLVDDLLTLTRGDSGSGGLLFEITDVAQVLSESCSDMQVLAHTKGVQLAFVVAERPTIIGDADALRRVFTILLDNAIKATSAGGSINVSVTAEGAAEPQSAVITVEDTGIGIPQEDLPHIFDRFYRVNKDRSRETGGAGLGLAIAQWIVTVHGGAIQATSQVDCGSTFRVFLPLMREHAPSEILQNQKAS